MTEFREAFSDYSEALTHNLAVNIKHTTSMRTDNFPTLAMWDAVVAATREGLYSEGLGMGLGNRGYKLLPKSQEP